MTKPGFAPKLKQAAAKRLPDSPSRRSGAGYGKGNRVLGQRLAKPKVVWVTGLVGLLASVLNAQTSPGLPPSTAKNPAEVRFQGPEKQKWEIGFVVEARGTTTGIEASLPVPMDWPEQKVKVVSEDRTPNVRPVRYRTISNGVRQMIVSIPRLSAGESARCMVTFEVDKQFILQPTDTSGLRAPSKISTKLRPFLLPSPMIESSHAKIKLLAQQIGKDKSGWEKVEAIFDWVRDNIEYKFDPQLRGALVALDRRIGDCEEMTSLFVALCRVNKIPARSVWIPGHTYPEFYLQDTEGNGHWYPCQAAGTRTFGAMPEARPILQKGDSFRLPRSRRPVRYVSETLKARNASAAPQVQWVRRMK